MAPASKFLERSKLLTSRGIRVAPVVAGSKGCRLTGWPQFATTDPAIIEQWSKDFPDANTAAVCDFNGLIVLDCDVQGIPLQLAAAGIPTKTFTVSSGSKHTPHLYFTHTDYSRQKIKRNICKADVWDLKADAGYVVGPGSVLADGGVYTIIDGSPVVPIPDALVDWLVLNADVAKPFTGTSVKVSPKFDFFEFCDHYDIKLLDPEPRANNWYSIESCPFKGAPHSARDDVGFHFDPINLTFGFHCFAGKCEGHDKTAGDVVSFLGKKAKERDEEARKAGKIVVSSVYTGPIWTEETAGQKSAPVSDFEFTRAATPATRREYVLQPMRKYDGWFPRSSVSIAAGPSGAGKTTLIVDALYRQYQGEAFLEHETRSLPYLIIFADRGKWDNLETLERMGLQDAGLPIEYLPVCWGRAAAQGILKLIEKQAIIPAAVFVEGADTLVEDANKAQVVAPFMSDLQKIAEHFNLAVILSLGAPKAKPKEQHSLKRDRVFGTQMWPRMASTVAIFSISGDGTDDKRSVDVLHRNDKTEHFDFEYRDYKLVPVTAARMARIEDESALDWMQRMLSFTRQQFVKQFPNFNGAKVNRILEGYLASGEIVAVKNGYQVAAMVGFQGDATAFEGSPIPF